MAHSSEYSIHYTSPELTQLTNFQSQLFEEIVQGRLELGRFGTMTFDGTRLLRGLKSLVITHVDPGIAHVDGKQVSIPALDLLADQGHFPRDKTVTIKDRYLMTLLLHDSATAIDMIGSRRDRPHNTDPSLAVRQMTLAIARWPSSLHHLYNPDELKEISPARLLAVARKTLATNIQEQIAKEHGPKIVFDYPTDNGANTNLSPQDASMLYIVGVRGSALEKQALAFMGFPQRRNLD